MPEWGGWPDEPYWPMTPAVAVHPVAPDSKPGFASFWPVPVQPPVPVTVRE